MSGDNFKVDGSSYYYQSLEKSDGTWQQCKKIDTFNTLEQNPVVGMFLIWPTDGTPDNKSLKSYVISKIRRGISVALKFLFFIFSE